MTTLIYAAIAIAFLLLVITLVRKLQPHESEEALLGPSYAPKILNGSWLELSERIFDPSDARWLAQELAFPKLAKALTLGRKRLAIRWLEALQASFEDFVRTPDSATNAAAEVSPATSWQLLWLTIRFKFLVSYALVMVKFFGPYHRLIPSFLWVPFAHQRERSFRRAALANGRSSQ